MSIQEILQRQSQWTWDIMQTTAQLGEMIREDAITSVNLGTVSAAARQEGLDLYILSFQGAHLEQEFGADWLWSLGQSAYLVQAKRLDVVPRIGGASYTINIPQLDLLVAASQTLSQSGQVDAKPAYVFYNSMTNLFGNPPKPPEMGCVFMNAMVLQNYLYSIKGVKGGQQSVTVSPTELIALKVLEPWHRMFGSGQAELRQVALPPAGPSVVPPYFGLPPSGKPPFGK